MTANYLPTAYNLHAGTQTAARSIHERASLLRKRHCKMPQNSICQYDFIASEKNLKGKN